jgi:Uncharacterized Fe-S protein PflX, homolog of pyruvate formate lyase activating proteins
MQCKMCPRGCKADRVTAFGICGMDADMRIARIAPHFFEEPCISGTLGSGTVFFSGCCLKCCYCQNGAISHRREGRLFTPGALARSIKQLVGKGAHNINFVTPTHFTDKIIEALQIYRPPVPIIWNTSGYETLAALKKLDGLVDIYLPDLKHFSSKMSALICGAPDYFEMASQAIKEMCRQTGAAVYDENGLMQRGTLVRHLILPGLTGESIKLLDWFKESLPENTPLSLMRQYYPANNVAVKGLDRRITEREYERVLNRMLTLDINGFTQEKESADASYTPAFNHQDSFL